MNEPKQRRFRDRPTGAPTLINEGCHISGVISGRGDYQVSGEVEGDCDIEGTVSLTRNGLWRGVIRAEHVIISGHVEGDIVAAGKVEITAAGSTITLGFQDAEGKSSTLPVRRLSRKERKAFFRPRTAFAMHELPGNVLHIELNIKFFGLREHHYRSSRCMYTPLGLRLGYSLYPMHTGFKF